ncbi:aspartyl-phosphate phosphatase Spo0E family protein [Bacillus sp. HMF5848]|uniref:aspartyl-phosphate phosphatase Spo0E family protein n=1 Tax=Bacillus sp. HMF5848 TaxID=2495421 RepID=UPI000F77F021|nr:aspartyl-phosphate phosphatase Spo0E family protein [Bacillus sp. HMF5848]RSK27123.1 aspartyl-phosphate phosphatase Spo0E family protein [Bacillus sp. HMF5848]
MTKQELLTIIEKKRSELIQIALRNGFSSNLSVQHSQELDILLNTLHRLYHAEHTKQRSLS